MCFAANTNGVGGRTYLESRIKRFEPHFIYDTVCRHLANITNESPFDPKYVLKTQ